jgi:hypothetical protein
MIHLLPTELLWTILNNLEYHDLIILLKIRRLEPAILHFIQVHYRFHFKITSLLRMYEAITPTDRQLPETKAKFATQILESICKQVESVPKIDYRNKFSELLDIVQQLTIQRILAVDFKSNERDYALLCLEIRSLYLHTPSIRVLHDPVKYFLFLEKPLFYLPLPLLFIFRNTEEEALSIL